MVRFVYNLLFVPVLLLLLPGYLLRMVRRGGWRRGFGERFGFYPAELRARLAEEPEGRVWVQAVSVGEMLVALRLLRALREVAPGWRYLLSTTTTTGYALARPHAGPDVAVIYTPVDFPFAARRAWRDLRPAALVVVEGGLWPNLLAHARRAGRPVFLVNARLSPRSERRFRRGRALAAPALFRPLTAVAAPEPGDVARWTSVGVETEKVQITGNLKFDDETAPSAAFPGASPVLEEFAAAGWSADDPERPVLLLASTHPGEETLLGKIFVALRQTFPALRLVVAPRHVERAGAVADELRALGLRVVRRTSLGESEVAAADVLLLDTTGELRAVLPLGTVVVIGKAWLPTATGGQNPVEPLAVGRPVIVGPHMENFAEITAALVAADALVQVPDAGSTLRETLAQLLADAPARAAQVANAATVLARHRGAAARTAALIVKECSSRSRPRS